MEISKHWSSSWWCVHIHVLLMLLFATVISDSYGQTVTVTMNNAKSNVSANTATMICEFGINDATYAFSNLVWRKGTTTLAHFLGGAADPNYLNYCQTTSPGSPCKITRDSRSSQLVLSPVDRTRDDGSDYECQVTYNKGADIKLNQAFASLTVIVPTNLLVMRNGSSLVEFNDGGVADVSLDVTSHIFQCEVAGINPQATFTWTVGDKLLLSNNITEDHVVDRVTGLTTSTSNATLAPEQQYNGKNLTCKAVNYEGDPGVMFYLVLKVKDPCVGVECKNGGTCVIDPSMAKCNCTDGYKGEFCETDTSSSAERTSFRFEMIAIQCFAWMAFKLMYI